jgi:hypothetical protein
MSKPIHDPLDTVRMADRLNDIAGGILLANLAVAGLADNSSAVSALRGLLLKLSEKVSKISHEIHPGPSDVA